MAVINPEMYKKYTDNKKSEISTALDDKDISESEFNKIRELADARMAVAKSQAGQTERKAPPKYGERPAGVPQMKMGADISANPITLE